MAAESKETSPQEEINKEASQAESVVENASTTENPDAIEAKTIDVKASKDEGVSSNTRSKPSPSQLIEEFESSQQKPNLPDIYVGDTVRVGVRISEGNKERVQPYEGVVISKRHGGLNQTITVRRIFQGIGVERIFMLHSPQVASIKVERRGKVRRAKLFYLRERVGKATRVKQRFDR